MTKIKDNINDSYVMFNAVIMVREKHTSLSMLRVLFDQNSLPLYCIKVDTTVGINYIAITNICICDCTCNEREYFFCCPGVFLNAVQHNK